jgi:hypothetical protein
MRESYPVKQSKRPKKYQEKLSRSRMTFEQVLDTVLTYKPKRKKKK